MIRMIAFFVLLRLKETRRWNSTMRNRYESKKKSDHDLVWTGLKLVQLTGTPRTNLRSLGSFVGNKHMKESTVLGLIFKVTMFPLTLGLVINKTTANWYTGLLSGFWELCEHIYLLVGETARCFQFTNSTLKVNNKANEWWGSQHCGFRPLHRRQWPSKFHSHIFVKETLLGTWCKGWCIGKLCPQHISLQTPMSLPQQLRWIGWWCLDTQIQSDHLQTVCL